MNVTSTDGSLAAVSASSAAAGTSSSSPGSPSSMNLLPVQLALIGTGLVGNCLSAVVMSRRGFRGRSTSILLTALACSDTACLLTSVLYMLYPQIHPGAWMDTRYGCKIHTFLSYLFPHLSSWILVSITIERLVAVCAPFRAGALFTGRRTVLGLCALLVLLAAENSYALVLYETGPPSIPGLPTCHSTSPRAELLLAWLDVCCFSLVPIPCIATMNAVMLVSLRRTQAVRGGARGGRRQETGGGLAERRVGIGGQPRGGGLTREQAAVLRTVLTVTTVFILLTLPVCVIEILFFTGSPLFGDYVMAFEVGYTLMIGNFCVNFFLYCLTGSKFRAELKRMFCD